jgi:PAS domain-containing protein
MDRPTSDLQRFLLQENVKVFRARLAEAAAEDEQQRLRIMLAAAERELALLDAEERGVRMRRPREADPELDEARAEAIERFHAEFDHTGLNASLIDPAPGLVFVEVGGVSDVAAGRPRRELIGRALFSLFPENPADPSAEGVRLLYDGLRTAAESLREQAIPVFRYDVQSADGVYAERWWRATCRPILDDRNRLLFVALISEDVTDEALAGRDA